MREPVKEKQTPQSTRTDTCMQPRLYMSSRFKSQPEQFLNNIIFFEITPDVQTYFTNKINKYRHTQHRSAQDSEIGDDYASMSFMKLLNYFS